MKRLFCLLIASLLLFSSCFDGREHLQNDPSDTSEKSENNESNETGEETVKESKTLMNLLKKVMK